MRPDAGARAAVAVGDAAVVAAGAAPGVVSVDWAAIAVAVGTRAHDG
ncbi:hypothetical protein [Mycolicibacterium cosmeticum]|nr:hypothetical protein [Mycolicibacterium cosmeticum]